MENENGIQKVESRIHEYKRGISKNDQEYASIKLDDGKKYTCFEADVCKKLKDNEGNRVIVVLKERPSGHINVIDVLTGEKVEVVKPYVDWKVKKVPGEVNVTPPVEKRTQSSNDKHTTMYVSYAKDIFIALVNAKVTKSEDVFILKTNELMDKAIELVKLAKDSFS